MCLQEVSMLHRNPLSTRSTSRPVRVNNTPRPPSRLVQTWPGCHLPSGFPNILALAVLITLLTRPRYVLLLNCETQKQAAEVTELLEGEGMDYEVSDDPL